MQYFRTSTPIVWVQDVPRLPGEAIYKVMTEDGVTAFEYDEKEYLVTIQRPDGTKYVELRNYNAFERSFYCRGWHEIVAYARPAESEAEFQQALADGMADVIEWRRDGYPSESRDCILLHDWHYDDWYEVVSYDKETHMFGGYALSEFFAWAKLPEPCKADKTIGELMTGEKRSEKMEYLKSTIKTPFVWQQFSYPKFDDNPLITVKTSDGKKFVEIGEYDADENYFYHRSWNEIVGVAMPAESVDEFRKAKADGTAGEIEWHFDCLPNESKDYLVRIRGFDLRHEIISYDKKEGCFDGYDPESIVAWAEIPEPCSSDEVIGQFLDDDE